jgi:hypothetical protein
VTKFLQSKNKEKKEPPDLPKPIEQSTIKTQSGSDRESKAFIVEVNPRNCWLVTPVSR